MNSELPWQVDGVNRQARDTAQEAAQRAGMSVGEWLDSIILNSARPTRPDKADIPRPPASPDGQSPAPRDTMPGVRDLWPRTETFSSQGGDGKLQKGATGAHVGTHTPAGQGDATHPAGEDLFLRAAELVERLSQARTADRHQPMADDALAKINGRLDGLTRRLGDLFANPPAASPARAEAASPQIAHVIANFERRLDQLLAQGRAEPRIRDADGIRAMSESTPGTTGSTTALDRALREIADRQRMLEGTVTPAEPVRQSSPSTPPLLPRAQTQDLSGLEQQLRQINTQLEALNQPHGLDKALDTLRDDLAEIGVMLQDAMPRKAIEALEAEIRNLASRIDETRRSGADGAALTGIERTLTEMRDALRALTPAEALVGLDRAVADLSRKIDLIGTGAQDPAALEQVEGAIVAMRGIASHVASNDALTKLTAEVRALSEKVDQAAKASDGGILAALEGRIATLADALQAHNQKDHGVPGAVDAAMNGLVERIEQAQLTRGDQAALGHLEDRIAKLVEKLDASDARLQHLEAIERGMADLLIHLERHRSADPSTSPPSPEVDSLSRNVADLRQSDRQTQDALEAVHGTLGHVVDRLTVIEGNLRRPSQRPASDVARQASPAITGPSPAGPKTDSLVASPSLAPDSERSGEPLLRETAPSVAAERRPIDPSLPPDHPLEPRSSTNRARTPGSPADRIAASEAALAGSKPPVIPDPGGSSSFIAAARRAAQAAGRDSSTKKTVAAPAEPARAVPTWSKRLGKFRALLTGTAAFIIVLGAALLARSFLTHAPESEVAVLPSSNQNAPAPAATSEPPAATQTVPVPAPAPLESPAPATSPGRSSSLLPAVDGTLFSTSAITFPTGAAASGAPRSPATEATGTIPRGAATPAMANSAARAPATPAPGMDLPAALGPVLRAAAAKGEPAAQYEVAVRLAEGRGVTQNLTEAAAWFERAAQQGLVPAKFRLGGLYEKGLGVKKDLDAARRLYVAAGEAGNGKALHNLAVLYAEGLDGKPDYQVAAKWFRKAADYGITDSQYNLAILYGRGIGLEQNLPEAYKWFALAARDGDSEAAKKRDEVGARLDQQALAGASRAVQSWQPSPQPDAAIEVKAPAGGWDATAAAAPPARRKAQSSTSPAADPSPARPVR